MENHEVLHKVKHQKKNMFLFSPVAFLCPGTVSFVGVVLCEAKRDVSVPLKQADADLRS